MAGSLLNVGVSGLKAYQTALATVGHNISNANTPGYSRQEVVFDANDPQYTGGGFIGTGVAQDSVRRISQGFLVDQLRSDTASFTAVETKHSNLEQIDNLLATSVTGLDSALNQFFGALQSGSDDPSSIPARDLLMAQSENLVQRFQVVHDRIIQQGLSVKSQMGAITSAVTRLAEGVANANYQISAFSGANGEVANDLLDERDELLRQLAEKVAITVVPVNDNMVNVYIGKGQAVVIGRDARGVSATPNANDASRTDITLSAEGYNLVITNEITGGELGGLVDFSNNAMFQVLNDLGKVSLVLADTVNSQHQLGTDLDGNFGASFFKDINDPAVAANRVVQDATNAAPIDRVLSLAISDVSSITADNYVVDFSGPGNNKYIITRDDGSNDVVSQGTLTGAYPTTIGFEGLTLTLQSGSFQLGDRYYLEPTRTASSDIEFNIDHARNLAYASPVTAEASLTNAGTAIIDDGKMLSGSTSAFATPGQLSPPLMIRFTSSTRYDVLDNSDPANPVHLVPPMSYQEFVPNTDNNIFTEDPGQTAVLSVGTNASDFVAGVNNTYPAETVTINRTDPVTGAVTVQSVNTILNESAQSIAGKLSALTGVTASARSYARMSNIVDGGGLGVTLNGQAIAGVDADALAISINADATLTAAGVFAVSDGVQLTVESHTGVNLSFDIAGTGADSVTLTDSNAGALGVTGGNSATVGGEIKTVMDSGVTFSSSGNGVFAVSSTVLSTFKGFQFVVKGSTARGDIFTIDYNSNGSSDNRNALGLVNIETTGILDGGESTISEGYGLLVGAVGNRTNQARISLEANRGILEQSVANHDAVSGVNLDEEAVRLIEFELAYNASARVVSVARTLFETLISAVS